MKRIVLALLLLAPLPAAAQAPDFKAAPVLSIGLAPSLSAPLGFSAAFVRPGRLGMHLDLRLSFATDARDNYYSNISVGQAEQFFRDEYRGNRTDWVIMNASGTYPLASRLAIYAGAGLASRREFRSYHDKTGILGDGGVYWVADTDADKLLPNLTGGAYLSVARNVLAQLGYDSAPRAVVVGISAAAQLPAAR